MGEIAGPELLSTEHQLDQFDCGNKLLNDWLVKRAISNQKSGASRTFVICRRKQVVGYYALSSGSVERISVPKSISRNMPESVPVLVLGRLAIDESCQRKRLGASLLKNALLRTCHVSNSIGVRALLMHAISDQARRFYMNYGFIESPSDPMTLLLSVKHIQQHL